MATHPPDDPATLLYQIELSLQRIAADPDDLAHHQRLRSLALRRKATGSRAAGLVDRLRRPPDDPVPRLLHIERAWSLDPGDSNHIPKVLAAMTGVQRADPSLNSGPVRRWLYAILAASRGD